MSTKSEIYNLNLELEALNSQKKDIENKIENTKEKIYGLKNKLNKEEEMFQSISSSEYIIKYELETEINLTIEFSDYICKEIDGFNYIYVLEPEKVLTLICNDMNVLEINTGLLINLKKLVCYNNKLEKLNLFNNKEIQYIHCFNNPFIDNDSQLKNMINSLPDRNNKAFGSLIINSEIGDRSKIDTIEKDAIEKDWLFGSPIIYIPSEWEKCKYNIRQINVADIWETAEYGKDRIIGIADTGFDYITPARCIEYSDNTVYGSRYVPKDNYYGKNIATKPEVGIEVNHGNRVSTIVCAKGKEFYGVAPKCQLYLMRVYNNLGINYLMELISELNYIRDAGIPIDVMNYSFNSTKNYTALEVAIKNFVTPEGDYLGIPFVSSCGNVGNTNINKTTITYPAFYKSPIVVGSINSNNKISCFSSLSNGVDIFSYGENIYKQENCNDYKNSSGTSYATPLITGCIALLKTIFIKKYDRCPTENELYNELLKRSVIIKDDENNIRYQRFNFMEYTKM